jgi:hypothetical protein
MRDTLVAAAGALLVAALNELRASLRARQADRDRRERLAAALATPPPAGGPADQ